MSFGERLSTRLFAAYLRSQGVPAQQHDAFDIGALKHAQPAAAGAACTPVAVNSLSAWKGGAVQRAETSSAKPYLCTKCPWIMEGRLHSG